MRLYANKSYRFLKRQSTKQKPDTVYGVIAYIPGPGAPMDDECHLDGWYFGERGKVLAQEMFGYFKSFIQRLTCTW